MQFCSFTTITSLYYASYPAGTELLTDTTKSALGNVFEVDKWGPIEYCIMAKHFERQGKSPYAYHAVRRLGVERMMGWNVRWRECVLAMIRVLLTSIKALPSNNQWRKLDDRLGLKQQW
ncbi:hypothetical protein Droror1_Dr00024416 [Drosera rotundifolia]